MKAELDITWAERCRLRAEARKLWKKIDEIFDSDNRTRPLSRIKASELWTEADRLWLDAVHRVCGPDVQIEWAEEGVCIVAGVMVFLKEK